MNGGGNIYFDWVDVVLGSVKIWIVCIVGIICDVVVRYVESILLVIFFFCCLF